MDPSNLQDSSDNLKIYPPVIASLGDSHPVIDASAWIAPGACVVGAVTLAADVSVWFGAVLRADNDTIVIGRGTNVQDSVVIHVDPGSPCRVGERCVIGHRAVLHGCQVGNESLIGIGAIVLNGAVVPDGCLLGAGALVPEGKELEPGCLYVGVPVRKVRLLDAQERQRILRNAEGYVARARRYETQLKLERG